VAPPLGPGMRKDMVIFVSPAKPAPELVSISEELVSRVKAEVSAHWKDLGPE
jgi:hypothetical protein